MNISELDIETRKIPPPIDPDYLDDWYTEVKSAARLQLQNKGEYPPTVKYIADDPIDPGGLVEGTINVSSFFISNEGKHKFSLLAPSLFSQLKAFAVCSIFESYCLLGPEKLAEYERGGYESMGDVPGAHEVLMVSLQTRAKTHVEMLLIKRDHKGDVAEVSRAPLHQSIDGEQEPTGTMVGWLAGDDSEVN